ncbi:hypothetical protein [Sulfobacillus harzensis]|uniref:Uncharacterized protein n=1 Tax=Sulfobacillus harzensis TaxID=2729629 RepID=A0A7Y0L5U3_9FIRM|nr:hypothetical protein [Sulfobacillus harzensis]NMP23832.1 hypothetical protein [Sulfobacillus harzensis]
MPQSLTATRVSPTATYTNAVVLSQAGNRYQSQKQSVRHEEAAPPDFCPRFLGYRPASPISVCTDTEEDKCVNAPPIPVSLLF